MTTLELLKVTKTVWGSIRDASPEEKNRILPCNGGRPAAGDGQYTCGK